MKTIYRIILIAFSFIFILITYLTFVGIETDRFNQQIHNKIDSLNKDLKLDLKKIKIVLDPLNFQFNVKTLGPKIKTRNEVIELESIKTQVLLNSILKKSYIK